MSRLTPEEITKFNGFDDQAWKDACQLYDRIVKYIQSADGKQFNPNTGTFEGILRALARGKYAQRRVLELEEE